MKDPMSDEHVCPVWLGYFLASPLRKLFENPGRILGRWVRPGMTVLEVGPAMGFFTLPLARMVGPGGRVVAVDVQEGMIAKLGKRARRAGLEERIDARVCSATSLGVGDLEGGVDVVLAFHVVHEVPDQGELFRDVARALAPGGRVVIEEPKGHVNESQFEETLARAREAGLEVVERPARNPTRAAVLAPGGAQG
jgi:ubiquinone/menaquinone biosynthesis C-methylase UbiE